MYSMPAGLMSSRVIWTVSSPGLRLLSSAGGIELSFSVLAETELSLSAFAETELSAMLPVSSSPADTVAGKVNKEAKSPPQTRTAGRTLFILEISECIIEKSC
jgi:hypothetical protein